MTENDVELIREMLRKQDGLDKSIMGAYGLTEIDGEKLKLAILDEVGELNHELKANWCWWKKTQQPVDKGKVLGELVDVYHFVLSYCNHFEWGIDGLGSNRCMARDVAKCQESLKTGESKYVDYLCDLVDYPFNKIHKLIAITEYLGFTVEQVYEAYGDKNKINYQRLERGY